MLPFTGFSSGPRHSVDALLFATRLIRVAVDALLLATLAYSALPVFFPSPLAFVGYDIKDCKANHIHAVTKFPRYNYKNPTLPVQDYVAEPMKHGQLKIFAGNEIEHMVAPVTGAARYSLAVFLHTSTPAPTIPGK